MNKKLNLLKKKFINENLNSNDIDDDLLWIDDDEENSSEGDSDSDCNNNNNEEEEEEVDGKVVKSGEDTIKEGRINKKGKRMKLFFSEMGRFDDDGVMIVRNNYNAQDLKIAMPVRFMKH